MSIIYSFLLGAFFSTMTMATRECAMKDIYFIETYREGEGKYLYDKDIIPADRLMGGGLLKDGGDYHFTGTPGSKYSIVVSLHGQENEFHNFGGSKTQVSFEYDGEVFVEKNAPFTIKGDKKNGDIVPYRGLKECEKFVLTLRSTDDAFETECDKVTISVTLNEGRCPDSLTPEEACKLKDIYVIDTDKAGSDIDFINGWQQVADEAVVLRENLSNGAVYGYDFSEVSYPRYAIIATLEGQENGFDNTATTVAGIRFQFDGRDQYERIAPYSMVGDSNVPDEDINTGFIAAYTGFKKCKSVTLKLSSTHDDFKSVCDEMTVTLKDLSKKCNLH